MNKSNKWPNFLSLILLLSCLNFLQNTHIVKAEGNSITNINIIASDITPYDEQWFFLNASIEILEDASTYLFTRIDIDPTGFNLSCSYTNSTDTFVKENDPNNYLELDTLTSIKTDINSTDIRIDFYVRIHPNITREGAYDVKVYSTASGPLSDSDVFTIYILGMEQVLFGGWYDLLNPSDTEYCALDHGYLWTATESWRRRVVSTDGVIKNLRVKLSGAPGEGKKYTFALMLNQNPTGLTFDISDAETTDSNMINQITVTGGDVISLQCVPDGTPTARYAYWTSVFESDNPYESLILGGSGGSIDNVNTIYGQLMCAFTTYDAGEHFFREVMPTSGTIENFYVDMQLSPGSDPDAYRYTVRLNGGTNENSPIVTITAPALTGNDTTTSLPVIAGDVLTMMIEPLNTPSTTTHVRWGLTFKADINGESIVMGGAWAQPLDKTDTEYTILSGWGGRAWVPDESWRYQLGQNCTLKNLNVLLSDQPGSGNKYDFSIRIAGGDSNVVATVSGLDTTGNSGALNDTVLDGDYVNLKVVPDSRPTIGDAYWGFVSYIEPPPSAGIFNFTMNVPSIPTEFFGAGFNSSSPYVELYWYHNLLYLDFFEIQNSTNIIDWTYLGQNTTALYTDDTVLNGTNRYYKVKACRYTGVGWKNSTFSDVNFEKVYFILGEAPPSNGEAPPPVDDYSVIFLAIGLILMLIIAFLYIKGK